MYYRWIYYRSTKPGITGKIDITGTPFSLNYSSKGVSGRKASNTIKIALTDNTMPASLQEIYLEITFLGRIFKDTFSVQPNLSYDFTWDGFDCFGRKAQGKQNVQINIGYAYTADYMRPLQSEKSFGLISGVSISGDRARALITLWQKQNVNLGIGYIKEYGIGGWSLDVHHLYNYDAQMICTGNGKEMDYNSASPIVNFYAGNGDYGYSGDGGPATQAEIGSPWGISAGPDGSIYLDDLNACVVRKVNSDGIITTIAGIGQAGYSGDGGPATQARLNLPTGTAVGSDGSIYIADNGNNRIRKVCPNGIITTIAGNGQAGYSGDNGPAIQAKINNPFCITVSADGNIYFADEYNHRIRRIDPDGIITTIAGNGQVGYSGDNGPAIQAGLYYPYGVAIGNNGEVYFSELYGNRIRKVDINGIVTTIAGNGTYGYNGDGIPAIEATLDFPAGIAYGPDGSIYIADVENLRVRRIKPNGIITTFAGNGNNALISNHVPATATSFYGLSSVAFGPDGKLYIADPYNAMIVNITSPMGNALNDLQIVSEDGNEKFQFDYDGKHLKTTNALTGSTVYEFKYNQNGNLDSIVDAYGNSTVIERTNTGNPTAIIGPYGHRTVLGINSEGYLNSVTNPANEITRMTYANSGLLSSFTDAKSNSSTFVYDTLGRLTKDTDANGGFTSLQRVELEDGYEVRESTAEGVVKVYKMRRLSDGTKVKEVQGCCGQSTISYTKSSGETEIHSADNTIIKSTVGPDPIYGMMFPLVKNHSVRLPSGIQMVLRSGKTVSYTSANEIDSIIQSDTINGKIYRSTYAGVTRTFSTLTPEGRTTSSTIDSLGRVIYSVVSDLAPVTYEYDERGRIKTITEGSGSSTRVWQYEYDNHGSLATVINPLNEHTTFTYDEAERNISKHFADMRQIRFGYDVNGNIQTITTPDNNAHTYDYNAVNLPTEYNPPALNTGATLTTYNFNLDKDLTAINRPDGLHLQFKYDDFGRLDSMVTPDGDYVYVYDPVTHKLVSSTTPESNQLFFGYDGNITNSEISYGLLNDTISYYYNNNFQREARIVAGFSENYTYDNDGLLLSAGELNITRNSQNGLITGSTIGNISDALEYNSFGENTQYTVSDGIQNLFGFHYNRDKLGRITTKTETVNGQTHTFVYLYNSSGYLERVTKDGATVANYTFDLNGNRLSYSGITGGRTATYDAQDRMLTNGNVSYTYNVNGDLESKTEPSGVTTYAYDVLGNLKSVVLPGGKTIEYIVDDKNRRIGKKVNGVLVKKWVYDGLLKPALEYDGQNNVVARYVYGTQINVPEYMVKNGETYRFITDHLGSVRAVVNSNNGVIVQRIDYDEYGIVLSDNNPGFTPFGFAGGLYDSETGLVRFGARDYDAFAGRWTSKDPIGFEGGDANLYRYVNSDPVNFMDPNGQAIVLVIPIAIGADLAVEAALGISAGALIGGLICELSESKDGEEKGKNDDENKIDADKVNDDYLKKKGIDAEKLKEEYVKKGSRYDIYKDKKTGDLYLKPKKNIGPIIKTHINIK